MSTVIKTIKIVYSVFLYPGSNWQTIVQGQLQQLNDYGLLNNSEIFICITDCFGLSEEAEILLRNIAPDAKLYFYYKNEYEYPALNLLHQLATENPDNIFIYLHTKGMSHGIKQRTLAERTLFQKTFENWRENIKYFDLPGINKIGLFPAVWREEKPRLGRIGGWIWYNFWYAKGSYLCNCDKPKPEMNRYYYEAWVSRHKADDCYITNDCKSLYLPYRKFIKKEYYTASEADFFLHFDSDTQTGPIKMLLKKIKSPELGLCYFAFRRFLINAKSLVSQYKYSLQKKN